MYYIYRDNEKQAGVPPPAIPTPLMYIDNHRRQRKLALVRILGIVLLSIPAALLLLCTGTYLLSNPSPEHNSIHTTHDYLSVYPTVSHSPQTAVPEMLSNGTHLFQPTLILISLDGFRADYLDRSLTPNLKAIGHEGLRADYMVPSFPSSTFPNHYSLVTGLYPGEHGIVSNIFYDRRLNKTFVYKDSKANTDPRWWSGGEPIWVTAERQKVRTAIDMWPGSTAAIQGIRPAYLIPYADNVHPTVKTQQLIEWLDMPTSQRPGFLATYMPEVDQAAHRTGPDAKPVNNAIQMVDEALGELHQQLISRNLTHIVNLMVVSDHGMATAHKQHDAIYLDDHIDVGLLRGLYGWPLGGLVPWRDEDIPEIYQKLKTASHNEPSWEVYLREDIPDRFHYSQHHRERTPPILVIPRVPYYVTTRQEELKYASENPAMGVHGYDNLHPLMRATFVAAGPAFRSRHTEPSAVPPEPQWAATNGTAIEYQTMWGDTGHPNIRHPPFENIELYGLMSRILGVLPAPHNGTRGFSDWWLRP